MKLSQKPGIIETTANDEFLICNKWANNLFTVEEKEGSKIISLKHNEIIEKSFYEILKEGGGP